jgi:hypothetical protein
MATTFVLDLSHPEHGTQETQVTIAADGGFHMHYEDDIAPQARKNVASRFVDYESFGSGSAYADRLEEVGDVFKITGIAFVDVPARPDIRFAVRGNYSTDEQGDWSDWIMASDKERAEFLARWTMAENERADPSSEHDFQITMEEIEIKECYPEPFTKDELAKFVGTIARMIPTEDGDDSIATVNRLIEDARKLLGVV